ncbi:MAG: ubiquinol-cytochrome c reductase iron-sulfur subunit [Terriglobia bacterium]
MNEHPDPELESDPEKISRRRFLSRLSITVGSIAAAIVAIPSVAFLLGLRKPPFVWRSIGKQDSFKIGSTVKVAFLDPSPLPWSGVSARTAAWLRRVSDAEFIAFSVDCTHLGCPVRWLPTANLFMCPCHGGVYYADGTVASGPPPRPLPRYPVRIQNGNVQILTSPLPITT